jgi:hypothetical protein
MASGKISPQARERISEHCRAVPYGENVHYLDGERLEVLEKYAHYRTDQDIRSVLLSLDRELDFNLRRLASYDSLIQQRDKCVVTHLRVAAIERALSGTLPPDLLGYEQIEWTWNVLELVNGMTDFAQNHPAITTNDMNERIGSVMAASKQCEELRELVKQALRKLDERYNLSVEVMGPAL